MQSGPGATLPVYWPDQHEGPTLWAPLGNQSHLDFALGNELGFEKRNLQCDVLLCSV